MLTAGLPIVFPSVEPVTRERLLPGLVVILAVTISWGGFHWDIAWHGDVGRETVFSPPHLLIMAGIVLGAAACSLSLWGFGSLSESPGLVLALVGFLMTGPVLAFDNFWHVIFGPDVTLWSPGHLFLIGMFLTPLMGAVLELNRAYGPRRRLLPFVLGVFLACSTLLLAEYELGFPHYRLIWDPLVLALLFGFAVALGTSLGPGGWTATLIAISALAVRGAGLILNAAVERSLPIPPIGLLPGALACDVIRMGLSRHARLNRYANWLSLSGGWLVAFLFTAVSRPVMGKTWWPDAVVLPALLLSLLGLGLGGLAGSALGRRLTARPLGIPRSTVARILLTAFVVTDLLMWTALPLLDRSDEQMTAQLEVRDSTLRFVPEERVSSGDWVSIFGTGKSTEEAEWVAGLTPTPEGFVGSGRFSRESITVWYLMGDGVWAGTAEPPYQGEIPLRYQVFRSAEAPPAWAMPASVAVIFTLSLLWLSVAFWAVRTTTSAHRSQNPGLEVNGESVVGR
jgi:hypothetical protein